MMDEDTPRSTRMYRGFTRGVEFEDSDTEFEEMRRRKMKPPKVYTLDEVKTLMMGRGSADSDWGAPGNTTVVYKIGIYGWRKRCLYVFLLLLMITVIVNLALTVWILKVMDFSVHGMGQLRMTEGGVRVEGDSEFLQGLYTSSIKSHGNAALTLESARNITLNARNSDKVLTNRLLIGNNKISSYAKKFEVKNTAGEVLFSAEKDKVSLGSSTLNIAGSGGANVRGSVKTPLIQASSDNLRLESPSRSVVLSAPEGVTVQAESGPIDINSSGAPINIQSLNEVTLEGERVRLKSLAVSQPQVVDSAFQDVYQLCVCAQGGKLFLAPPQGTCQATGNICD